MWVNLAGFDKSGREQALAPLKEEEAQSDRAEGSTKHRGKERGGCKTSKPHQ